MLWDSCGNLDEKVSERVLCEILIQAGHVVDLHMPCDKETNRPKGFAFAEYETEEVAQYAVKLFSGLVRIKDKTLKFAIAGHDKPSSNGNNPVTPKLNPIPLPNPTPFVHCSDMPVSHTPAYPVVNGRIAGYGFSPNLNSYVVHPQAFSGGPVHNHGEVSNGMHDYSRQAFGSVLNIAYRGPFPNVFAHGAAKQPIIYPSY
ncbi:spliceosome-associated protein 49-like isoform X2 [Phragmites australis]|uniref:spliceosome-associated protein 49-like isoform X2 n=1 Tax=Phragmites australis TaxID=29695 RepID=UPI002D772E37|nr:spliceosome-associated protein 49-like isoform X2 [Phragmites australis]XP_062207638.1 spliceosome-associated protein 49-like isoform X2 [Phragmites australis]